MDVLLPVSIISDFSLPLNAVSLSLFCTSLSLRLQEREVVYGKYFVKGSSLCSVLFEWTGDGGNTTVAVKGKFTNEKEVPLTKEE